MTYYMSSKYYGRTRMHDNIVPLALTYSFPTTMLTLQIVWETCPIDLISNLSMEPKENYS